MVDTGQPNLEATVSQAAAASMPTTSRSGWCSRAVAVDPGRAPGTKRIVELREALVEHDVRCVFIEPQFPPDLVETLTEGTIVRTAELDPIGVEFEPGPDAGLEMMRALGDAIAGRLGDQ